MHKTGQAFRVLIASFVVIAALSGCGAQEKTNVDTQGGVWASPTANESNGGQDNEPEESANEPSPVPSSAPADQMEITIYATDAELEKTLERKVTIPNADEADMVKAALAELQKDAGDGSVSLWKDVHILAVTLNDGIVTVDIHIPDEARLGAPGELQMVETLKSTLFQFSFVEGIDILVVGEAVESMMGHVDLDHPIVR
ncbi:GerMN domain-containing protein [Paenibacillus sp. NPDC057967]|uniref:GerMN domain-containing protein n=1 Tax=Paenibacillus sp. NPDC057967 TaxID=3346293 RepID=UPI0036DF61C7